MALAFGCAARRSEPKSDAAADALVQPVVEDFPGSIEFEERLWYMPPLEWSGAGTTERSGSDRLALLRSAAADAVAACAGPFTSWIQAEVWTIAVNPDAAGGMKDAPSRGGTTITLQRTLTRQQAMPTDLPLMTRLHSESPSGDSIPVAITRKAGAPGSPTRADYGGSYRVQPVAGGDVRLFVVEYGFLWSPEKGWLPAMVSVREQARAATQK